MTCHVWGACLNLPMRLTKQRKKELVMHMMRWHASKGRYLVVSSMYNGATRDLIRSGDLVPIDSPRGVKCIALPEHESKARKGTEKQ